ncbi:hypothetical protein HK097_007048 [Rhizophlyctis rosea]|uniref:3-methyl-2-oxobutanoate hydroxymethyltransferase n=1 Tax=Rhizophlyctis rosea TaxID=64517 RepID=A0AAD5X1W1_9FUNG|nr:hypothetical protein HK097_007048 [Rhizophlyctis rosea]
MPFLLPKPLASTLTQKRYSSHPPATQPSGQKGRKKVTLQKLNSLYAAKEPIATITAHDYPSGVFADKAHVELCLVGDSLAMVALGYDSTNQITLDEMLHHCRAVSRGAKHPFLVGDLPFGTYERSPDQALETSIRFIREGHMDAVKLEGGMEMEETVKKITTVGIPVLGHIGLTPQRHTALSGFKVQGKTLEKARLLLEDALALQSVGCFAIVLEAIPEPVATFITSQLRIPTIGIGAGSGCSGQVLVQLDALGAYDRLMPKFCKVFSQVGQASIAGLQEYVKEVKSRTFPDLQQHTYSMDPEELKKFNEWKEGFSPSSR